MAFEGTLQEFTIRMHGHTLEHPYIEAQQGDTASRKVRIHLKTFDGADFLIPYGATAVLSVDKTDGHKVLNECEIEDSSTIIITLTSQTLACPGKQLSQIYIFTDKGDIKTQKFYIHVPKAVYDQDAIESSDEYGILLELIERIENLGGGGSGATEEQLEQIEQNKNDITRLKSDLNELSNMKSGVIVQTASGESIVVNDSSDDTLRGLRLFGKTEQFSTTGAQLFDASQLIKLSNDTLDVSEDGYLIVATGGAENAFTNSQYELTDMSRLVGKTVYLKTDSIEYSISAGNLVQVIVYAPSGTIYKGLISSVNKTEIIEVPEDATSIKFCILTNNTSSALGAVNTVTIKGLRLVFDTNAEWEPYTGGIASPNPQYPQELVSVGDDGDIEVGKYGANLIPFPYTFESQTTGGLTYTALQDGSIKVTGTKSDTSYFNLLGRLVGDYATEKICFSRRIYVSVENNFLLSARLTDGTYTNGVNDSILNKSIGALYVECKCANGTTVNEIIHPIISYVDGVEYEPYNKQSLTALTPNGLPGIKVTDASLATYTDADGQMWCADEIDFERGVYVKRVLLDRVKSNLGWNYSSATNRFWIADDRYMHANNNDGQYCTGEYHNTHFANSIVENTVSLPNMTISYINADVYGYAYKYEELNGDLIAWKSFLDANEVYTLGILATPIETPLSKEEIAQYAALHSNYPVTTILNDSDAHMEVKYNADTKNYIDNKFTELTNAILSMGGNV